MSTGSVDMKLEVVVIPVADTDRAEKFYSSLGWRQDVTPPGSGIFQFTPPGSGCSVQFGANRTTAAPGSAQGLWLIVSDLQAALDKLAAAAKGAPHPEPAAYAAKFSAKYEYRNINGGIGHNLPQEAPKAFAKAVVDVDGYSK